MATLETIEPGDIGRRVRLTTARGSIEGELGDFSVETEWITSSTFQGGWTREPSRRTVTLEVGGWSGRLPVDTALEWVP